jgi:predicted RNase H-like nuclease (RuvC/YqgF family)
MNSLYQLNSDAVARQCAQSRADAAYWEALKNNKLRYLEEANSQLTQTVDHQASRIAELEAALAKQIIRKIYGGQFLSTTISLN